MTQIKTRFAALGIAALLVPSLASAGGGAKLTRADFERCNQQAMQVAGVDSDSPAASPQMGTGSQSGTGLGTSAPSGSGSQYGTQSGSGMPTGGTHSGPTSQSGTGMQTGSGTQSGSGMSGAGSAAGTGDDAQLERVIQAYRDCLKQGN
jgi:hypothetical protein